MKDFIVKLVTNKHDINLVMENYHYLKRKGNVVYAFKLTDNTNKIYGICTYGSPISPSLCKGLAGEKYKNNIIELTRLFTVDNLPPNTTSWFVSKTLKELRQIAPEYYYIIAYADSSVGHVGKIYQALSFKYTGLSAKRKDWKIKGKDIHTRTITHMGSVKELRKEYGDNFYKVKRARKHRYVKINRKGNLRKKLLEAVKYEFKEYPKDDTEHAHHEVNKIKRFQKTFDSWFS